MYCTRAHTVTPPAALGALDEEEDDLRTTLPHRGHAVTTPGRMLLERVWAMELVIWLPMPPLRCCNVQAHNPDSSQPNTPTHKDWKPSSDVDAQAHPIIEQDAHAVSAALLKGEEMRKPAKSSEQTAALGSPSTISSFSTPLTPPTIMPADSEATAQPCTQTSCAAHDFQSGRMVHPGTSSPCLAPGLCTSEAFAEDPDKAGGATLEEGSAQA